jgi:glutamate-ammonia-ligase adenylyltransferase
MVEHRLQLEQGQQTHTLPANPQALHLLALRCGVPAGSSSNPVEVLTKSLAEHLHRVRTIYERRLPSARPEAGAEGFALRALPGVATVAELSFAEILELLRAQGSPLYHELAKMEVPARASKSVHRFLTAALQSSAVFEQVTRAASALPEAVELLHLSEPLGSQLLRQPARLAQLQEMRAAVSSSDAAQLGLPLDLASLALPAVLTAIVEHRGALSRQMGDLRHYFTDAVFAWGASEVCLRRSIDAGLRAYSELAEQILRASLAVAAQHEGAALDYTVVALGRLGTAEMDFGSDADLVFIVRDAARQEPVRKLMERFLHVVSGYTSEGTLFPLDVRLRPRGGEGELVQTAESTLDYFRTSAAVWEAATYLKARVVASSSGFGAEWDERLRCVAARAVLLLGEIRAELRAMRKRLEDEAGAGSTDNFKTGLAASTTLTSFFLRSPCVPALAPRQVGLPQQIERLREAGADRRRRVLLARRRGGCAPPTTPSASPPDAARLSFPPVRALTVSPSSPAAGSANR